MIVYGTCPLRPVWSYLQPKLENAKFAEIDPAPPIGNLAVALRERKEYLDDLCKKVNIFDSVNSFDDEIIGGHADFLLITVTSATNAWKYTSKEGSSCFYSPVKLDEKTAEKSILEKYTAEQITLDDIENELCYLCENLPKKTKLLIQTVTEVVFPQGEDEDYCVRIELNKVVNHIVARYDNAKIIDIRKYANSISDFFDPSPNHFNRAIGLKLAQEVLEIMEIKSASNKKTFKNTIPANAVSGKKLAIGNTGDTLDYTAFIRNGYLHVNFDLSNHGKYNVKLEFYCHRHKEDTVALNDEKTCKFAINKVGYWYIHFVFESKENPNASYWVRSGNINYNIYNYNEYMDSNEEDYENFVDSIKHFRDASLIEKNESEIIHKYLADLSAVGVKITDYFVENDINDITIFTTKNMAQILLPFFYNSAIRIKNIITVDSLSVAWVNGSGDFYNVREFDEFINDKKSELTNNDTIFFAVCRQAYTFYLSILQKTPAKLMNIEMILSDLYTKTFFNNRFKRKDSPKIVVVRCPNLAAYFGFPFNSVKPNERVCLTYLKNDATALKKLETEFDKFPEQYKLIQKEELKETLTRPVFYRDNFKLQKMRDKTGKYFNIKDGFRVTTGQPKTYDGKIFIVGNSIAYGCANKDSDTIASKLQSLVNKKYCVENRANMYMYGNDMGYADAINMIEGINPTKNDIVIFLLNNWRADNAITLGWHYPLWKSIEEPIIKLDAFPLFEEQGRPDYFLLPEAYTADGNQVIAELIKNKLSEIGYL